MRRPAGIAAVVCALALFATACGGGEQDEKSAADAQKEEVAQARPLKVDSEQREISWTDLKEKSHVLRAAPKELLRGSIEDLKNVRLDGDLKKKVPYYLTVSFTNEGSKTLERPSPERDFALVAADGKAGERITVFSSPLSKKSGLPKACTAGSPDKLEPGGSATVCSIVMMPKDREPAVVSHSGRDAKGEQTAPVIWKAGGGDGGTPSGVLAFGKPADSSVQDADRRTVKVRATPQKIRAGKVSDLSGFKLSGDQKKKVPYYVTVEYRNNGSHKLLPSMNQKLELRATSGKPAQRLTLIDFSGRDFTPCVKAKPDGMVEPKATVTECSIHMLPEGDSPVALAFTGEGEGAEEVVWRAPETDK